MNRVAIAVVSVVVCACPGGSTDPDGGAGGGASAGGGRTGGGVATAGGSVAGGGAGGGSVSGGGSVTAGGSSAGGSATPSITLEPMGQVFASSSLRVTVAVVGSPTMVALFVDGAATPAFTFGAPPYVTDLPLASLSEGAHTIVGRATFGAQTLDSMVTTVIVDRTPPTITRQWPETSGATTGTTPFWLEPWGLTASEELILPGTATVQVTVGGTAVPTLPLTLSADSRTVTFRLVPMEAVIGTASITLSGVTDRAGNPIAGTQWTADVSHFARGIGVLSSMASLGRPPAVALHTDGTLYTATFERRLNGMTIDPSFDRVQVRRWTAGVSSLLPAIPASYTVGKVQLAIDGMGLPVVAFERTGGVEVHRLQNGAWQAVGAAITDVDSVSMALDPTWAPVVAVLHRPTDQIRVLRYDGTTWQQLHAVTLVRPPLALARATIGLAVSPTGAIALAWSDRGAGGTAIFTAASTAAGAWTAGQRVTVRAASRSSTPALAWGAGGLFMAFVDNDGFSSDLHLAVGSVSAGGPSWVLVGRALDVELTANVSTPAIAIDSTGQPVVAWPEVNAFGGENLWLARLDANGRVQLVSGAKVSDVSRFEALSTPAVAVAGSTIAVSWLSGSTPQVARWNATRAPGLTTRPANTCSPLGAGGVPQPSLAMTNCFSVPPVGEGALPFASGDLIPYELNSQLWSDGTLKRRWLQLPAGGRIGYADAGAFDWPIGTVLVKEFSIETTPADRTTRAPIETRFLVRGTDGGWDGYTYQWANDFRSATLLSDPAVTRKSWPLSTGASYSHIYPNRSLCIRCHNTASGGILGPQAAQLNRTVDYGGVADDQLSLWTQLGLFSSTPAAFPTPMAGVHSSRASLEQRLRGYLHSNCAHCHRPGGERPSRDFRYETPLAMTNLCAVVNPGDAGTSLLHIRFGRVGAPMPPVATDLLDQSALGIMDEWIGSISSCP